MISSLHKCSTSLHISKTLQKPIALKLHGKQLSARATISSFSTLRDHYCFTFSSPYKTEKFVSRDFHLIHKRLMSEAMNPEGTFQRDTTIGGKPDLKELLEKAKEEADLFPDNPVLQEKYIKLLSEVDSPKLIERIMKREYAVNDSIIRMFILALQQQKKFGEFPMQTLLSFYNYGNQSSPPFESYGGSSSKPLFIKDVGRNAMRDYFFSILLTFLVIAVLMYLFSVMTGKGEVKDYQIETSKISTTFKDVIGAEEAKEELRDIVEYLKDPKKFSRLGAHLPKGVLLVGPPGCGKTLLARALAGEAGVTYFFASGSEFEEMFVGIGAARIRTLFENAKKNAPCVIFIDEFDAIATRRDSYEGRHTRQSLNQLLVELDGFSQNEGIIVLAATNAPEILDPAVKRPGRFDRHVHVMPPDVNARTDMLKYFLQNRAASDVDYELLAKSTIGFTGADIANLVNIAAVEASKRNLTSIPFQLLLAAKDRVDLGPERKSFSQSEEQRKLIAFHEGGHALVALYTGQEFSKATIIPRGHAGGFVNLVPKEGLQTKEEMERHIDVAMGGRAAEELVYGPQKVTQGASSDFQGATQIAQSMLIAGGMGTTLGKVVYDSTSHMSSETQAKVEQEMKQLLEVSYQRASKLLGDNREDLNKVAKALLDYETLSQEDIKMVVSGKDLKPIMEQRKLFEKELAFTTPELPTEKGDIRVGIFEKQTA